MKLGVLFSGGKDSTLALHKASEKEQVTCLITVLSKNPESYMFHTPNIWLTRLQAEAIGLPIITRETEGVKEAELEDLKAALMDAISKFGAEGVYTGAIQSNYQKQRIERICGELRLRCFSPLWGNDQEKLLREIVSAGFRVIISGIFAYPLDRGWLGREMDEAMISELVELKKKYGLSPSGEGGEIETTVLDAPIFRKRLEIVESEVRAEENSGVFFAKRAKLVRKGNFF